MLATFCNYTNIYKWFELSSSNHLKLYLTLSSDKSLIPGQFEIAEI